MPTRDHIVFLIATVLSTHAVAPAEPCEPEWVSLGESGSLYTIQTFTKWDPDGPGPGPESIIAGGSSPHSLDDFGGAARWTGTRWEALGSGPGMPVSVVTTWDPDGAGPAAELLIACGTNGVVKSFNGATWTTLGTFTGTTSIIKGAITWDPDGPGPNAPVLLIGGWYSGVNGQPLAHLAAWDGQSWTAIGATDPGGIDALTTWDADNDPQTRDLLLAGGARVSAFDGTAWSPLDGTDDDYAYAITTWDRDNDGPQPPVVCAAGAFQSSGVALTNAIAIWNGTTWEHLAPAPPVYTLGSINYVNDLVAGDPDGPGPAPSGLTMISTFIGLECFFWDGTHWIDYSVANQGRLNAAIIGDPDGDGPAGDHLIIDGGGNPTPPSFRDEFGWQPLGSGLQPSVVNMAVWDPDGSGPEPETVFAAGSISRGTLRGMAMLRNGRWEQLGDGLAPSSDTSFYATFHLRPWKGGPSPHDGGVLLALSDIALSGSSNPISLWNGQSWTSIPRPPTRMITTIATWDPDGQGAQPESLVIGGQDGIFVHDGSAWAQLVSPGVTARYLVFAWDPDANGPLSTELIAWTAPAIYARWTGTEWAPMPPAFNQLLNLVGPIDPDGDGPEPAWLLATREIVLPSSGTEMEVVRWNGAAWIVITEPCKYSFAASFLTLWDPDGTGPKEPMPVVGRNVAHVGETVPLDLMAFSGGVWSVIADVWGPSPQVHVRCALSITRAIPGFPVGSLFIGGYFDAVDGVGSLTTAAFRACAPPPCVGDVNGDGDTDVKDFNIFAHNFAMIGGATRAQGDLSGDGKVTVQDFNILAADFACQAPE